MSASIATRLLLICLATLIKACGPGPATPTVDVPIRELLARPQEYAGGDVCTQGVRVHGFEVSALSAGTEERGGEVYLVEPTIWLEGAQETVVGDCFRPREGYEFCPVRVCGRFEHGARYGHLGGYAYQLASPGDITLMTQVAGGFTSTSKGTTVPGAHQGPGETGLLYESLFAIPVGEAGVTYRGVGVEDMLDTGPESLAVLKDGSFAIADTYSNRLLIFTPHGELHTAIDLYDLGIANVSEVQAVDDGMILLEVNLNTPVPLVYRLNRLSASGDPLASYDLPTGLHLEDGLTGIAAGADGQVLVELEFGGILFQLEESGGRTEFIPLDGFPYQEGSLRLELPDLVIRDHKIEMPPFSMGLGGLRVLGVLEDGSFFVVREDVLASSPVLVDQTVHRFNARGEQTGVARFPLNQQFIIGRDSMALGPDGAVYALLTHPDSVEIARLIFYRQLDPLEIPQQ